MEVPNGWKVALGIIFLLLLVIFLITFVVFMKDAFKII